MKHFWVYNLLAVVFVLVLGGVLGIVWYCSRPLAVAAPAEAVAPAAPLPAPEPAVTPAVSRPGDALLAEVLKTDPADAMTDPPLTAVLPGSLVAAADAVPAGDEIVAIDAAAAPVVPVPAPIVISPAAPGTSTASSGGSGSSGSSGSSTTAGSLASSSTGSGGSTTGTAATAPAPSSPASSPAPAPSLAGRLLPTSDANPSELRIPAKAPIVHQEYFKGERELFGYSPLFKPGVVTFDIANRPTIRAGEILQRLYNETWTEYNWYNLTNDDDMVTGPFVDERVVFDQDGSAYTLATGGGSQSYNKKVYLLYSRDYSANPSSPTWTRYLIANGAFARLEFNDTWNLTGYPPAILIYENRNDVVKPKFGLIIPTKNGNTLTFSDFIPISTTSVFNLQAGGAGNSVVSVGNKIHVVYPEQGLDTPQYAITYDRITRTLSPPVFIGNGYINGGGSSDPHCIPVITVDSLGYLHVITGAHNSKVLHTKSKVANSIQDGWMALDDIGEQNGGFVNFYTYVALCCDKDNTLHVVMRYYAQPGGRFHTGKYMLAYLRKKQNRNWEKPKFLVIPFHYAYSHYYHKLNIDRKGRLFLNYWYYLDNMNNLEAAAYKEKWPHEDISARTRLINGRRYYSGQTWHDPVILMSDDGGDSWRIATTDDFIAGLE